jgi:hypothetical protein
MARINKVPTWQSRKNDWMATSRRALLAALAMKCIAFRHLLLFLSRILIRKSKVLWSFICFRQVLTKN